MALSTRIYGLAVILLALLVGLSTLSYQAFTDASRNAGELERMTDAASGVMLAERDFTGMRMRVNFYLIHAREADRERALAVGQTAERALSGALGNIPAGETRGLAEQAQANVRDYTQRAEMVMTARKALLAPVAGLREAAAGLRNLPANEGAGPVIFALEAAATAANSATEPALALAVAAAEAVPPGRWPVEIEARMKLARDSNAALKVFLATAEEGLGKIDGAVRLQFANFRTKQLARADELSKAIAAENAHLRQLLLIVAACGTVLGAVLAFAIARGIIKPLNQMTDAMTRLSGGDGNVEIPGLGSRNEIGRMAAAVDIFKQNADKIAAMLKAEDTTREIGGVISRAADGDLTVRVRLADKAGFLRDIGTQVNQLLEASHAAFKEFGEKARATALSVGEASTAVAQVSDGARAQNQSLTQVATAVKESMLAVKDVSDNTRLASEKAENAMHLVERSLEAVGHMSEIVDRLALNSRKVNQITQVIAQIANRTHILSLNAAIEAARAGEHGKGFVVVAQEVGKLAESAGQNANQIAEIVEQTTNDTLAGKNAAEQVRTAIVGISGESRVTTQMIHSSAAAIEEQRASITQIDGTVSELKNIANSNAAAAEEITATMMQLSQLADETRRRVDSFKMA